LIDFISKFGHAFKYSHSYISCNYSDFSNFRNNYFEATQNYTKFSFFCLDFYNYLKKNIKRFHNNDYVDSVFSWWKLDVLKRKKITEIAKNDLSDWINEISNKEKITYCSELLIIVVEKYFHKYPNLEKRLSLLYEKNTNPFVLKFYKLNNLTYLHSNNYISEQSFYDNDEEIKKLIFSRDDYISIYGEVERVL